MHNRRIHSQRKRFWQRMQALFLVVFILVLALIGIRLSKSHQRRAEEYAAEQAMGELASIEPGTQQTFDPPPILFPATERLLEQNEDLVGMLAFGDMNLYVCQAEDNFYYASHRFDGSEDEAGMIYMDFRNSIWPASDNIVLYGHNMKDGSRFGTLNRYEKADFLTEHPTIRFATLYEVGDYRPIAVFYTTADQSAAEYFNFARINFSDATDFDRYISEAKAKSIYHIPSTAEYGDQLLTLATCSSVSERGQLVILCRKMK